MTPETAWAKCRSAIDANDQERYLSYFVDRVLPLRPPFYAERMHPLTAFYFQRSIIVAPRFGYLHKFTEDSLVAVYPYDSIQRFEPLTQESSGTSSMTPELGSMRFLLVKRGDCWKIRDFYLGSPLDNY